MNIKTSWNIPCKKDCIQDFKRKKGMALTIHPHGNHAKFSSLEKIMFYQETLQDDEFEFVYFKFRVEKKRVH